MLPSRSNKVALALFIVALAVMVSTAVAAETTTPATTTAIPSTTAPKSSAAHHSQYATLTLAISSATLLAGVATMLDVAVPFD